MTWTQEQQIDHLIRLPWTILRETTPEGDQLLRIAEIPSAVGTGATSQEMEKDLWDSLRESLRAYLHFNDPIPRPKGVQEPWLRESQYTQKVPYVIRVPEAAATATADAWSASTR